MKEGKLVPPPNDDQDALTLIMQGRGKHAGMKQQIESFGSRVKSCDMRHIKNP